MGGYKLIYSFRLSAGIFLNVGYYYIIEYELNYKITTKKLINFLSIRYTNLNTTSLDMDDSSSG